MVGKLPDQGQSDLFRPLLKEFINLEHELVLLSKRLDWEKIEKELSCYYSEKGQPSVPIRLMVGCLLLKRLYNLGDETLAKEWVMNPCMQYFSGMSHFTDKFPFDPSDFVHFRKRLGEEGIEKLFVHTIELHGPQAKASEVLSDTTVQENNITFPTDSKLAKKIIENCNKIAKGKAHKKYEFGNKIGLMVNPKSLVILGVESYQGNPHYSKTIEPLLAQMQKNLSYQPKEVIYDRGGRGQLEINGVKVLTPKPPKKNATAYEKNKTKKKFRRRAAIEPVIGHLKKEFRMEQNYLNGESSPKINALLAAAGWNLKKLMETLTKKLFHLFSNFFLQLNSQLLSFS